jgi:uncharacterized Fe-S cluster protein YjdI
MGKVKEYSNDEVTILWKPDLCIHSEKCFKGLPSVFDPNQRPWINAKGASSEEIIKQVGKCPSGALSMKNLNTDKMSEIQDEQIVEVTENGPLMVYGNIKVKMPDGSELSKSRATAFCRCGASGNKPYCDGSHKKIDFKG